MWAVIQGVVTVGCRTQAVILLFLPPKRPLLNQNRPVFRHHSI